MNTPPDQPLPADLHRLILRAPKPSPWGMRRDNPKIETGQGLFLWVGDQEVKWISGKMSGFTLLLSPKREVVLILDFQCYALQVGRGRLLVWSRPSDKGPGKPALRHWLYDLDALRPIPDPSGVAAAMRADSRPVAAAEPPLETFEASGGLRPGRNEMQVPASLQSIEELLMVGDILLEKGPPERLGTAVYVLRPRDGSIEVIPQDWFNANGGADDLYVWLNIAVRDPATGHLAVAGTRIGTHLLDASGRQVQHKWE